MTGVEPESPRRRGVQNRGGARRSFAVRHDPPTPPVKSSKFSNISASSAFCAPPAFNDVLSHLLRLLPPASLMSSPGPGPTLLRERRSAACCGPASPASLCLPALRRPSPLLPAAASTLPRPLLHCILRPFAASAADPSTPHCPSPLFFHAGQHPNIPPRIRVFTGTQHAPPGSGAPDGDRGRRRSGGEARPAAERASGRCPGSARPDLGGKNPVCSGRQRGGNAGGTVAAAPFFTWQGQLS